MTTAWFHADVRNAEGRPTQVIVITAWFDDDSDQFRARLSCTRPTDRASEHTEYASSPARVLDRVAAWLGELTG